MSRNEFSYLIDSYARRAKQLGANAVNIVSYYRKVETSSTTDFEYHSGAVIAAFALKDEFVMLVDE